MTPPLVLKLSEDDDSMGDPFEREFLNQGRQPVRFKDKDYSDHNKNVNRLKQFTFVNDHPGNEEE